MIFSRPAYIRAFLALCCGVAVTAAAPATIADRVTGIAAGPALVLEKTGPAVLAGVTFPDETLAQAWLGKQLLQKPITYTPLDMDRYGRQRVVADVTTAMLRDGVAVLDGLEETAHGWQDAETQARTAHQGVWGVRSFVLSADRISSPPMEFHVVEGVVTRRYDGRSATYLNFGADWHSDFSVMIAKRDLRRFKDALASIREGSRVRVRGVLVDENGPMIKLTRPGQLEIL